MLAATKCSSHVHPVDWFSAWPAEALRSVAEHFLHDVDMEPDTMLAGLQGNGAWKGDISHIAGYAWWIAGQDCA